MEYVIFDKHLFADPIKVITCSKEKDLPLCFDQLEDCVKSGLFAAGFTSYNESKTFPLFWFGIFKYRHPYITPQKSLGVHIKELKTNISKKEYIRNIRRIKKCIERGETYQVNYTFKYKFRWSGDPISLFEDLKSRQKTLYSSLIKTNNFWIISLSPELFFSKRGKKILVRPMKGTIGAGKGFAHQLKKSKKDKSENIMIVDMLRNDMGRICDPGSIKTEKIFNIEKYKTLYQMTSTICGNLKAGTSYYQIFKAMFPSGSVTGAPKIKTMEIINNLEKEKRKIYTGSIGFISPDKYALFNVAIRTLLLDKSGHGEMGVGSGITYSSDTDKEFDECNLKADFLLPEGKNV